MQRLLILTVLVCALAGWALAQTLGEITGEVQDQSGALVPGASITVTNTATNGSRTTTANSAGLYSFPGLTPGTYQLKATAPGFQTAVTNNIELQVQQTARVDFALKLGNAAETVQVEANATMLTTDNATVGTVIEQTRIA